MNNPTPSTPILSDDEASPRSGITAGVWSEVGLYHANNEDSVVIQPEFYGVADGVGGGSMGDVASATLMDYCRSVAHDTVADKAALSQWFSAADETVRRKLATLSNRPGASTMVGVWLLNSRQIRVIHVGDCRLYRFASEQLTQLTEDQTYARFGEPPPANGSGDDPARMVGVGAVGVPEINDFAFNAGESLLLCSDGLHKFLPHEHMTQLIQQGLAEHLDEQSICQQLVHAAKAAGSHDDVSALLLTKHSSNNLLWWLLAGLVLLSLLLMVVMA